MAKHIFAGLATILVLTLLVIFTTVPVLAFDARSGATVTVASGEVVDDDLYVAANSIIIDGTINGDLWAAGNSITVNGVVNGSVMAVGRTVNINGDVGHAVRAGGETIIVNGDVSGDVIVGCSQAHIASTAKIGGDLLFGAGNARIAGLIEGNIKGQAGEIAISDEVKGNVDLEVESLTILPTANIKGNLTYTSEQEANIHPGAQISGTPTHNLPKVEERQAKSFPSVLFSGIGGKVTGFLMALIAGLIIILLAPKQLTSIAEAIRSRPGPSAGWGALILFLTPIAAIIVCITIIGIPVGLIALALWGIAIYLAQIPVGLFIGRWIIGRFRSVEGKAIMVGALALGLVILKLLRLIPHLGFFIALAVILFGLGAVVASERRRRAEAREVAST
ncbi:MAG: polymer-forming cytoskeletal protein [Dehalococcoidia bacterium]|nr:polymer-forming cytoskeletal protein [Dehalococcoidia bacterium]